MTTTNVSEIMTTTLVTVTPTDSLVSAWELMSRGDIHHLPVVVGARCVGLLDDRMIAADLARPRLGPRRRVSDAMPLRVRCVLPDTLVRRAAEVMRDEDLTALPVVDATMRLVGMVTDRDMVRIVARGGA
ncbi:MAG: L-aspartate semialdehyde sulfurtransferase [Pseudonocardiales bacterium]|jgi:CBS-domain-containing membrane protein|nr:L-aspartate semialdehyde sulfurtransferase [Pseudonocardiales bacterium]